MKACARARAKSDRPATGKGVPLLRVERTEGADSLTYANVTVNIDRAPASGHRLHRQSPDGRNAGQHRGIEAQGAAWWPLAMARELDDAICRCAPTSSTSAPGFENRRRCRCGARQRCHAGQVQDHWLVRETIGLIRRTFSRIDVSSRSLLRWSNRAPASLVPSSNWRCG